MVGMVEQARMNKILQGLGTLQGAMTVKLNNLAAMEINQVRPFFLGALDMFWKYQRVSCPMFELGSCYSMPSLVPAGALARHSSGLR